MFKINLINITKAKNHTTLTLEYSTAISVQARYEVSGSTPHKVLKVSTMTKRDTADILW